MTDWTSANQTYYYTYLPQINYTVNSAGTVIGGIPFYIFYVHLTNPSNPRVACLFQLPSNPAVTFKVIAEASLANSTMIACLTPAANSISNALYISGGTVLVFITDNGIDYSAETNFTF